MPPVVRSPTGALFEARVAEIEQAHKTGITAAVEERIKHGEKVIRAGSQHPETMSRMSERSSVYQAIGDTVGMHYNQVGVWRSRYTEFGVDGLFDEDRPGRPPVYTHDEVIRLVSLITELPPDGATRSMMDALAQRMHAHGCAISASQVWRICQALDLKPWQTQSWMTSHDPDFWEKAADVCGLYLNPPEHAVVWSVDEKSQIQAKSRVSPTKPARPGIPARRDYGYQRQGRRSCSPHSMSTRVMWPPG